MNFWANWIVRIYFCLTYFNDNNDLTILTILTIKKEFPYLEYSGSILSYVEECLGTQKSCKQFNIIFYRSYRYIVLSLKPVDPKRIFPIQSVQNLNHLVYSVIIISSNLGSDLIVIIPRLTTKS